MKKVIAAALICAVSSFAAWDKFPVIGDGKGESNISFYQSRQGADNGDMDIDFKIRYSPLQNLELMSKFNGLGGNHIIGVRYQVIPVLSAGVDVGFPIPEAGWIFTPNIQFSTEITSALSLGSNVGASIYTKKDMNYQGMIDVEYSRGVDLEAGIELDFALGKSVIWAGFDFSTGITHSKIEAKDNTPIPDEYKEPSLKTEASFGPYRGLELTPSIGYIANVSDNLSLGTWTEFSFGEKVGKGYGNFWTTIGLDATVKF